MLLEALETCVIHSRQNSARTAWILTNRPYSSIAFFDLEPLQINLDQEDNVIDDIKAYIHIGVARLVKKRRAYEAFARQIYQHLELRADRMFLLVKLLLDLILLSTDSSRRGIHTTLDSLPDTLSTIYERIWASIGHGD